MTVVATRALLRIAWRNVVRNRWRSMLVALLVLLPVAGMAGAVTYLRTTTPTTEQRATGAMGVADVRVEPLSPSANGDELRRRLPGGTRVETIRELPDVLVLPGRRMEVAVRALDLNGLAQGMVTLQAGRPPADRGEVAMSSALATAAGLAIGDSVELTAAGQATVVGIVESPIRLSWRFILQGASLTEDAVQGIRGVSWLIAAPDGAFGGGEFELDYSVDVREWRSATPVDAMPGMLAFGGLALIETVLVAAAAFAVSVRRRQRELGILAAAGAQPRHLAGTVLGEGLILGGVAAAAGAMLGVLFVVGLSPWLDGLTDRRTPGIVVDPLDIGLAAATGVVAALIATAVPAWTAGRMPALVALSGRRPPAGNARRMLLLGVGLVGLSAAMTAGGAALLLGDGTHSLAAMLIVVGAIVGVVGLGACSPWLLAQLERLGVRLPLVPRIAMRDMARARSRNAPLITAMLASLALAVAVSATTISTAAGHEVSWRPWLRADQLLISGPGALTAGPEVARQMHAIAAAPLPGLVSLDGTTRVLGIYYEKSGGDPSIGADNYFDCECPAYYASIGNEELLSAMGAEAAISDFRNGRVIVFPDPPVAVDTVGIQVSRGFERQGNTSWHATHAELLPAAAAQIGIAAHGSRLIGAVVPREVAERLGFGDAVAPDEVEYLIRLDHVVTESGDVASAAGLLAGYPDTYAAGAFAPRSATEGVRLMAFLLAVLFALTVAAIAIALGESEARPDQRTLLAVGADPGVRRRIVAARAGVLALLAGLLAVPAGLLPVWGQFASREQPLVIPLPEIVGLLAILPLVAIAGALLLSRPIPQWSTFRDVAHE